MAGVLPINAADTQANDFSQAKAALKGFIPKEEVTAVDAKTPQAKKSNWQPYALYGTLGAAAIGIAAYLI